MLDDAQAKLDAAKQHVSYLRAHNQDAALRKAQALVRRYEREARGQAKEAADKQAGQRMLGFRDDQRKRIRLIDVSLVDPQEGLDVGDVCTVIEMDLGFPCVRGLETVVALLEHEWEAV